MTHRSVTEGLLAAACALQGRVSSESMRSVATPQLTASPPDVVMRDIKLYPNADRVFAQAHRCADIH